MDFEKLLPAISIINDGDWIKMHRYINKTQKGDLDEKNKDGELEKQVDSMNWISLAQKEYPKRLAWVNNPPFVLFYKGDYTLLEKDKILAVVGDKEFSAYGEKATSKLLKGLNKNTIVLSGLERGIDGLALNLAIDNGNKVIAVLGSGINNIYLDENKILAKKIVDNGGLIISEFPLSVEPSKENTNYRDRIIEGLSSSLLLVESYGRSRAYDICANALFYGKDVGCVPGDFNENSNCNKLINKGASVITCGEDLFEFVDDKNKEKESHNEREM